MFVSRSFVSMSVLKKVVSLFLLVAVPVLIGGCTDDLLNQTNPNQLSEGDFWQNQNDAHTGLMGAYSALQSDQLFDSDPYQGGKMRLEFISDNGYVVWQWMMLAHLSRGEFTSTTWGNAQFFSAAYDAIRRANRVIAQVPNIESMDQSTRDRMVAEAKVIRSTAYLQLAMTYGDVPLIGEPLPVQESEVPKSSKDEVFEFIFTDLSEAAPDLPVSIPESEWGRVPRGAALGMLARARLYHGDYDEAATAAQQVIDQNEYSLYPDYGELFTVQNEINEEVIFSVPFKRQSGEGSSFAAYWGTGPPAGYQQPLPDLAEAYHCLDGQPPETSSMCEPGHDPENKDPRFEGTLVSNGSTWKGEQVSDRSTYGLRKYAERNNLDHFNSPMDWYVLRYGHILLIRAEALVQSGEYSESEVFGLINQLRDRVDMPHVEEVAGSGLSQEQLLDIVKHERRVETAFEGLRYFDLKRWGEIGEAYQEYNQEDYADGYGSSMAERVWEERYMKWPLPQSEVDANDALEQHEGY